MFSFGKKKRKKKAGLEKRRPKRHAGSSLLSRPHHVAPTALVIVGRRANTARHAPTRTRGFAHDDAHQRCYIRFAPSRQGRSVFFEGEGSRRQRRGPWRHPAVDARRRRKHSKQGRVKGIGRKGLALEGDHAKEHRRRGAGSPARSDKGVGGTQRPSQRRGDWQERVHMRRGQTCGGDRVAIDDNVRGICPRQASICACVADQARRRCGHPHDARGAPRAVDTAPCRQQGRARDQREVGRGGADEGVMTPIARTSGAGARGDSDEPPPCVRVRSQYSGEGVGQGDRGSGGARLRGPQEDTKGHISIGHEEAAARRQARGGPDRDGRRARQKVDRRLHFPCRFGGCGGGVLVSLGLVVAAFLPSFFFHRLPIVPLVSCCRAVGACAGCARRVRARSTTRQLPFALFLFSLGERVAVRRRRGGCVVFFFALGRAVRHGKRPHGEKKGRIPVAPCRRQPVPFFSRHGLSPWRAKGARGCHRAARCFFLLPLSRGLVSRRIESPCGLGKDRRPLARHRLLFLSPHHSLLRWPVAARERHRRIQEEENGTPRSPFFFLSFGDIRCPGFLASGRRSGGAPRARSGGGRARRPCLTRRVSPFSAPH